MPNAHDIIDQFHCITLQYNIQVFFGYSVTRYFCKIVIIVQNVINVLDFLVKTKQKSCICGVHPPLAGNFVETVKICGDVQLFTKARRKIDAVEKTADFGENIFCFICPCLCINYSFAKNAVRILIYFSIDCIYISML